MIDELDCTLRELLRAGVPSLDDSHPTPISVDQIAFGPPDDAWRTYLKGSLKRRALDVYLVDVHENMRLRSNERVRTYDHGIVIEDPAPVRLDCHYLVTPWSPAVEATVRAEEEHRLLYQAARALLARRPLVPAAIWGGSLPGSFVALTTDMELPVTVAPPEGYAHFSYFWSAMGPDARWKPALSLIVTLPVLAPHPAGGPPVTTALAAVGVNGGGAADQLVAIGGRLLDARGPGAAVAVPGARVTIGTAGAPPTDVTDTAADGRFRLGRLRPGRYTLGAFAAGLGSVGQPIDVPSPTGDYDLRFT